jgi:hypothetical protein
MACNCAKRRESIKKAVTSTIEVINNKIIIPLRKEFINNEKQLDVPSKTDTNK